ncbi:MULTISPECIES: transcriptional repressor LexA [unclassified Lysobacter]|uniref:transcriptional repressor LexA n=1 Tax=unclassified Lysobacter TaxID=2635362 RepID=UPI001C2422D9|nr:transcriptional repressor LexA [Lysobacter sp. MMG2]MBU8978000.1 transcriptional repressor LexA [Lysobacter sp. MMG2]
MSDLTARQAQILAFIQDHTDAEGLPPTLQQIADAFGFRQACAAHKHVKRLEKAGHLQVRPNQARGIRLAAHRPAPSDDRLTLAVLGRVAAGAPIGADAGVERELRIDRALFSTTPDYLLRVQGDSMREEGIFDGDLVAVKRAVDARDGQVVIARVDEEITIKRLQRTARGIRLLPRNPDYAPIDVAPGSDFAIEGIYCGLVRPD